MRKPDAAGLVRTVAVMISAIIVVAWAVRAGKYRLCPAILIPACISYLACVRYSRAMSTRREQGSSTSRLQKAGMLVAAASMATAIIGLSDLAYLIAYHACLRLLDMLFEMSDSKPSIQPRGMMLGAIIGTIVALWVASCFGGAPYRDHEPEPSRNRRWPKLWWPVGLSLCVGMMLIVERIWDKYSFCSMMVEYHAGAELKADRPEDASLHAELKQWYRYTAIRPWLPVHPDEPR